MAELVQYKADIPELWEKRETGLAREPSWQCQAPAWIGLAGKVFRTVMYRLRCFDYSQALHAEPPDPRSVPRLYRSRWLSTLLPALSTVESWRTLAPPLVRCPRAPTGRLERSSVLWCG